MLVEKALHLSTTTEMQSFIGKVSKQQELRLAMLHFSARLSICLHNSLAVVVPQELKGEGPGLLGRGFAVSVYPTSSFNFDGSSGS